MTKEQQLKHEILEKTKEYYELVHKKIKLNRLLREKVALIMQVVSLMKKR